MSNDIRKLIDDNWEDIKELIAKKAEAEQKPKTIWDLKIEDGERYYYIPIYGAVCEGTFNTAYDEWARGRGNAFLTREEAEFELERRKIEATIRKHSKPFEAGKPNHVIVYNHSSKTMIVDCYRFIDCGLPCFESREIAQKAIDEIGKNRLKKYWFGITE